MKNKLLLLTLLIFACFISCEKKLDIENFSALSTNNFNKNAQDAKVGLTALYAGMAGTTNNSVDRGEWSGYNVGWSGWWILGVATTDEFQCGWGPGWKNYFRLNFSTTFTFGNSDVNFGNLTRPYNILLAKVTEATNYINQIGSITIEEALKKRYIAEAKALRAHYAWLLLNFYGGVPLVTEMSQATTSMARLTPAAMTTQIEKDYTEAAADLPNKFAGDDWGRFTKGACYMGLLKLYMHDKNWDKSVKIGDSLKSLKAYKLLVDYTTIFAETNEQNEEIILALPCNKDASETSGLTNGFQAHALPGDYKCQSAMGGGWGGYQMPIATFNLFNAADKRLGKTDAGFQGSKLFTTYEKANGTRYTFTDQAVPLKYPEDMKTTSYNSGNDIVIWRYADALLLLAEANNEISGPAAASADLLDVRTRAGLPNLANILTITKDQMRDSLLNERLFELWFEGTRREDLIRHGKYISTSLRRDGSVAQGFHVLFPLPRKAVAESNGLVKQNDGY